MSKKHFNPSAQNVELHYFESNSAFLNFLREKFPEVHDEVLDSEVSGPQRTLPLTKIVSGSNFKFFVLTIDNEIAAATSIEPIDPEHTKRVSPIFNSFIYLRHISVNPSWQSSGIGKLFLSEIFGAMRFRPEKIVYYDDPLIDEGAKQRHILPYLFWAAHRKNPRTAIFYDLAAPPRYAVKPYSISISAGVPTHEDHDTWDDALAEMKSAMPERAAAANASEIEELRQ